MRNDVPGGAEGLLVPPAGVAKAGGARARVLIEHLRAQIRALEQVPVSLAIPPAPGAAPPHPACSLAPLILRNASDAFGWRSDSCARRARPQDDATGPLHKLWEGGLHEIKPEAYGDGPAALAFALAVIAEQAAQVERRDLVLWCLTNKAAREWGRPYGPGLIASGLDPALLLIVMARNADDAAWALEEGLKSRALIAALAGIEIKTPLMRPPSQPCRASLAHAMPAALGSSTRKPSRHPHHAGASPRGEADPSPSMRRRPGAPSWQLTLERCRGEAPGRSFIVEFSHESFRFHLSAASSDRAAEAGESIERRRAFPG